MGDFMVRASRPLGFALSPLLFYQGRQVERAMPQLPEADGPRTGAPGPDDRTGQPLSLLIFGESTAAGVGVEHYEQSLAGQLVELLTAAGRAVTWHVLGRTAYTAQQTRIALLPDATGRYDLVVLMLGVNDVLAMTPIEEWRQTVRGILDVLRTRCAPGGTIMLTGVPRMDTFTVLPQPLRTVLGMHARALDVELIDLARRIRGVQHLPTPPIPDPRFLSRDGFHPSAAGYTRWADQVLNHWNGAATADEPPTARPATPS